MTDDDTVRETFRVLVEKANRKFARVQNLPLYGRVENHHYFPKVFKAYMHLWKFQQEFRGKLVQSGLKRSEIGEIASRIGQLYYGQYMRTSQARFLVEAYVFYEAILNRKYFEGSSRDLGVRLKELRFYARFMLVSLILNRTDMVVVLAERFKALVDDSKSNFRGTDFREWKLVVQEISHFINVEMAFLKLRPLRYCPIFDSLPASVPYVSRFHAKKVLKFRDAVLTSYHRNEVKFIELTLDNYRMLQCLEWEPSGSFYQKHASQPNENGFSIDLSGASGMIDMNLAADMTDTSLPQNPRKSIVYRPSVTHLLAVIATVCEGLPPDSIMLIYLSAAGKGDQSKESCGGLRTSTRSKDLSHNAQELYNSASETHKNDKARTGDLYDDCLFFGPKGNAGSNILYPGDIIPFTRRPVFLIVDSNSSHAFKVLHGEERGEPAAFLLSPLRRSYKNPSGVVNMGQTGSQFTFFLTSPLLAFCELAGLSTADMDSEVYKDAETMIHTAMSEWELLLCTVRNLNLVWAQVLSDHLLRRIILRFIFCRAVLSAFCPAEESDLYLPLCLPDLPNSFLPHSEAVRSLVFRLAKHLGVAESFHF